MCIRLGQARDSTGTLQGVFSDAGRGVQTDSGGGVDEHDHRFVLIQVRITQEVVRKFGPPLHQFMNRPEYCR